MPSLSRRSSPSMLPSFLAHARPGSSYTARNLATLAVRATALLFVFATFAQLRHWSSKDAALSPKPSISPRRSQTSVNLSIPDLFLSMNENFSERSVRIPSPLSRNAQPATKNTRRYSHFRCIGDENNIAARAERACLFENICYSVEDQEWAYYIRPDSQKKPVMFDSALGERFDFFDHQFGSPLGFIALSGFSRAFRDFWSPKIYRQQSPAVTIPSQTVLLTDPHAIFNLNVYDDNLGHLLWEEMGALWYSMVRLNAYSTRLVAMHALDPLPDRALNKKFRAAFFGAITPVAPVSMDSYLAEKAAAYVCFDQLMVGGDMLRFFQNAGWHNLGHEPVFYALRNRILAAHGLDARGVSPPQRHRIVFTNKTESLKMSAEEGIKNNRGISNLAELVDFVRRKYGSKGVEIEVVEWQKMEMKAQLELMQNTTIFITPSGGVSTLLPFLPEGAHAIVIDYFERNGDQHYGSEAGHSISMEAPLWNHFPHVKKQYYQVWRASDFVSDVPGKSVEECDWRYEVSTLVDLERMDFLIQAAFEDMEP
ncbi:hypothetical protein HDU84_008651 [Entophlyctis sp. JEL0112]|nr:hypothetical protein HDU84_008651 [Entophlyctis sp. JEL0112]